MKRSTITTHLGLCALALGALVVASGTFGFAVATVDRTSSVDVVDDEDAQLGIQFHNGSDGYDETVGEPFHLMNLTNNLASHVEEVDVRVERENELTMYSDGAVVVHNGTNDEPYASGREWAVWVECTAQTGGTHDVTVEVHGEGTAVEVIRDVSIECTEADA